MRLNGKLSKLAESARLKPTDVASEVSRRLTANGRETVSASTVRRWLGGESVPDVYEAAALAHLFKVSVDFLADDSLEPGDAPEPEDDELRVILSIVHDLGVKRAKQRLINAPESGDENEPAQAGQSARPGKSASRRAQ